MAVPCNPGKIEGGGILGDHQGKLIYDFTTPLGYGTNNTAEMKATLFGFISVNNMDSKS